MVWNKDKLGIWTSMICLVHCLAFPLMATTFPIFLELDAKFEFLLIGIAFLLGFFSFLDNAIKHKYYFPLVIFISGCLSILGSIWFKLEILNYLGLISFIIAHYINFKNIKESDGCHPHGCKH